MEKTTITYYLILLLTLLLAPAASPLFAQTETEPNNVIDEANPLPLGTQSNGTIGCGTDRSDYYFTLPPDDGTIQLLLSFTNDSDDSGADVTSFIYDYRGFTLQSSVTFNVPAGETARDTLTLHCRQRDTLYFRVTSGQCFSYRINYRHFGPSGPDDAADNDVLATATPIASGEERQGRIGYIGRGGTDNSDYYVTVPPDDGTVQLYVEYTNESRDDGADATSFIYDYRGFTLQSGVTFNVPAGETARDTLTLHCRQRDTLYFRVTSGQCFSYQVSYRHFGPSGPDDGADNDVIATATPIGEGEERQGRIGYIGRGGTDNSDYYVTVPPDDGTVQLYVEYTNESRDDGADATSFIYDYRGFTLQSRVTFNVPAGETARDTLTLHCRQRDTLYFRVTSGQCFSYRINYRHFGPSGPDDGADNDVLATATPVASGEERQGRIGYIGRGGVDNTDYYVMALPDDGTVQLEVAYTNESRDAGADATTFIYDYRGSTLLSNVTFNVPAGETVLDTLTLHCLQRDTVYFRVSSGQCFSYRLTPLHLAPAASPDLEPNNAIAEANPTQNNVPFSGRVGYRGRQGQDGSDYYRIIVPELSTMELRLDGENTSGTPTADLTAFLYNKNGRVISSQLLRDQPVGRFVDTLTFACLPADTIYLRLQTGSCFGYEARYRLRSEQPTAAIEYSRYGNRFAFVANAGRDEEIMWDFGDMTTSDGRYPVKEFGIGVYDVTLEATNTFCNVAAISTEQLVITGIEEYSPKQAGVVEGAGTFNVRLFGAGLSPESEIRLTRGGVELEPAQVGSPNESEATALFSVVDAAAGSYDLSVTLSDGQTISFPGGFEIYEDEPDFDIDIQVNGPRRIRNNRWTDFSVTAANDRGRMASGVPVLFIVPEGIETNILEIVDQKEGFFTIKGDVYDAITFDPEYYFDVLWGPDFDRDRDSIVIDYEAINANLEDFMTFPVDTVFGEPFEGTAYWLYFPLVPAESTAEIRFKLRSPVTQDIELRAFAFPFTLRNTSVGGEMGRSKNACCEWFTNVLDAVDLCAWDNYKQVALQTSAVLEYTPTGWLQKVAEQAGKIDIGSQLLFQAGWDAYHGNFDSRNYTRQIPAVMGELLGNNLPSGRWANNARESARLYNRQISANIGAQQYVKRRLATEDFSDNFRLRQFLQREVSRFTDRNSLLRGDRSTAQFQQAVASVFSYAQKQGINLASAELTETFFDEARPPIKDTEPKKIEKKRVRSLTSFDPNAIYGEDGVGDEGFIRRAGALHYEVLFENVDTAEANAQIVQIDLTLDPTKFDLSRTELGAVSFGGNTYFLRQDRHEYFTDIDLRPAENLIVRVQGKIDTLTGESNWQFTSLDPETMDFPQGFDEGFLPPNRTSPEGEGSVSFTTFLLSEVASGDSLGAQALIYFDDNEPIATNVWSNIVDEDFPQSELSQVVETIDDTTFVISYSANDPTSSIDKIMLSYREAGEAWNPARITLEPDGNNQINIQPGVTYEFYVTSQDIVGNREDKPQRAELTILNGLVGTTSAERPVTGLSVYPNPSRGEVLWLQLPEEVRQSMNTARPLDAVLVDMQGKVVLRRRLSWDGANGATLPVDGLTAGAYVLTLRDAAGRGFVGKVVVL